MNDNLFFKPTPLFKEYMILNLIERDSNITQRMMSNELGVAVSMINAYLDDYEDKGYIKRKYMSSKVVNYFVTSKGVKRRKLLNISYLNSSQKIYKSAKRNIEEFLKENYEKGYKNIFLYGAGEVSEILLNVIFTSSNINLKIVGIIDDDITKIGTSILGVKVVGKENIGNVHHDGVLIATIHKQKEILENIKAINYDLSRVIAL